MGYINWKPLVEEAKLPERQREGDAGYDLFAVETVTIRTLERALVPLGFEAEIASGHCCLIIPRSGLAVKHGITVLNSPGLIDSNYRGQWHAILVNLGMEDYTVEVGDRVAQAVPMPATPYSWNPVEILSDTERGVQGMGSSGK